MRTSQFQISIDLLLNPEDANATIEKLANTGDQRSHELLVAFRDGYLRPTARAAWRRAGDASAPISAYFMNPEISEVFCANEPTFSMDQIDDGKIVCIAMPQKFQSERLYINTILKLSLLLPRPEPVRQTGRGTREGQSHHSLCR